MAENYLIHHGVKGMKWGVRRRSKLYGLDKRSDRKVNKELQDTEPKAGSKYIPQKQRNPFEKKKEKQPLTPEQKQKQLNKLDTSTKLAAIGTKQIGAANQAYNKGLNDKKAKSALEEAQQMSDKELRDRVNRLNLERQYSQMSPQTVSKGEKAVSACLNAAEIAGGMVVTGLTVATLIKQLRN